MSKVLQKLAETGLRLTPEKCCFAKTEIEYLGYTLTPNGVKPNDIKVKAITEFPTPKDVSAIKRFLGILNFYRNCQKAHQGFCFNSYAINCLNSKATGKTVTFQWAEDCGKALSTLKQKLATAPLLMPPDLSKPFYVWSDASIVGFGAVWMIKENAAQLHMQADEQVWQRRSMLPQNWR